MKQFDIIGKRYWWFALSILIIVPGLVSMVVNGFNLGIDFTGGTLMDLKFAQPVSVVEVRDALKDRGLENSVIQLAGATQGEKAQNVFIRTRVLDENEQRATLAGVQQKLGTYDVLRVEKVGAVIGSELTQKAILALVVTWILMIAYLAYRFEIKFAVSGILAIIHDILVVLGIFSLFHIEIDATFVAAILTIAGYSINDTVVIFDRIRENLRTIRKGESWQELTNQSIWQTMRRSLFTVATVLFATAALYFFGGESTRNFSLALLIGFTSGCYSSIFNASPIWVTWKEIADRRHHTARMAKTVKEETKALPKPQERVLRTEKENVPVSEKTVPVVPAATPAPQENAAGPVEQPVSAPKAHRKTQKTHRTSKSGRRK